MQGYLAKEPSMASTFTKKIFRLVDPILSLAKVIYSIPNYIADFKDYSKYKVVEKNYNNSPITFFPLIHEKLSTNEFDAHYQFQSIWAGEKNLAKKVDKHYDIASKMDFGLMLSLAVPVEFIDYRKLDLNITIFNCVKGSLLAFPTLPESIPSLSCLHVIEHIGFGRYGDPLSAS